MKKVSVTSVFVLSLFMYACGGSSDQSSNTSSEPATAGATTESADAKSQNPSYDPERGEGKFKTVDIGATVDPAMATAGQKVYDVKCSSCHKLTDEKLVGPGWKGVTQRHKAEWIMNFVTNTDQMIDKDPKAQSMLEICMVRMPNQNLDDQSARSVYEFMRKNDGVK